MSRSKLFSDALIGLPKRIVVLFSDIGRCEISQTYKPYFNASSCPVEECTQVNWIYYVCSGKMYKGEILNHVFLDGSTHLYMRVCPSVRRMVSPSIGWMDGL